MAALTLFRLARASVCSVCVWAGAWRERVGGRVKQSDEAPVPFGAEASRLLARAGRARPRRLRLSELLLATHDRVGADLELGAAESVFASVNAATVLERCRAIREALLS